MRNVVVVLGTRPEAIKCAPVIWALREDPRFNPVVISTGQHRQMLDETLDAFDVRPDVDLDVMSEKQTLTEVTQRMLRGLAEHLPGTGAEAVLVHGDTATTLAGALAGFQHRVPVVHIEAGLRSGELHSPFPEEGNRRMVTQISDLHLAPTPGNSSNLIRDGVSEKSIVVTGNTVVDALRWASAKTDDYGDPALADLADDPRRVILASAHRREAWSSLPDIGAALCTLADTLDVRIVVPLHRNPVVREALLPLIGSHPSITVVDPMAYLNFCALMGRSDLILSDSSGAEEEGPALGKPTLVLREVTERPEAVEAGKAQLVGRARDHIISQVTELLGDSPRYQRMTEAPNPYGDGDATTRSIDALAHFFGDGPAVMPFVPGHAEIEPITGPAPVPA